MSDINATVEDVNLNVSVLEDVIGVSVAEVNVDVSLTEQNDTIVNILDVDIDVVTLEPIVDIVTILEEKHVDVNLVNSEDINVVLNDGVVGTFDHRELIHKGINTHSEIDSHIGDLDIHFPDAPDDSKQYVRENKTWQEITIPTVPVTSVFGRTGDIVAENGDYTKAQVGLGNVDNTSDLDKPISLATQTALDLKADELALNNHTSDTTIHFTEASIDKYTQSEVDDLLDLKIDLTEKAANNGVATLDGGGKIPSSQLPSTVMEYKGTWNALTNTPTLADGIGDTGDVYLCNVSGTQDLGSGLITFTTGDWVVYSGSVWEKSTNSNIVMSVNGQTGIVVLTTAHIDDTLNKRYVSDNDLINLGNLSGVNTGDQDLSIYDDHINNMSNPHSTSILNLTDTTITTPVNNDFLYFDGVWRNKQLTVGDIGDISDNYLNLSGSNANQDVDIGLFDFSATNGNFSGNVIVDENIGIGTNSNPLYKLTVDGGISQDVAFFHSTASATRVVINNSSNTGFGLAINNDTKWSNAVFNAGGTNFDFTLWNHQLSSAGLFIDGDTNDIATGGGIKVPFDNKPIEMGAGLELEFGHNGSNPYFNSLTPFLFNQGLDIQAENDSVAIRIGDNYGAVSAKQDGIITVRNYTTAEEDTALLFVQSQNATDSILKFGGGSTVFNAVTEQSFWTATSSTNLNGIERFRVNEDGLRVLSTGIGNVLIGELLSANNYGAIGMAGSVSGVDYNLASSPTDLNLYINRPLGKDILFRENNITQMILSAGGNFEVLGTITQKGSVKSITTETSDYAATINDYSIIADGTNNPVTIFLPLNPVEGQIFNISCLNSDNAVEVDFNSNNFYDSSSNEILFKGENLIVQFNGTEWIGA